MEVIAASDREGIAILLFLIVTVAGIVVTLGRRLPLHESDDLF